MEKRFAGPRAITLQGLMAGTLDITNNFWGQQVNRDISYELPDCVPMLILFPD